MLPSHASCTLAHTGHRAECRLLLRANLYLRRHDGCNCPARMNLAALQWAAVADNLPVFTVSVAEPMHRRRRARPAGVVAGGVLGFVVGVVLGFAFAAGVHAGPHGLVATVPLVLVLVLASALGSPSLRAIST